MLLSGGLLMVVESHTLKSRMRMAEADIRYAAVKISKYGWSESRGAELERFKETRRRVQEDIDREEK